MDKGGVDESSPMLRPLAERRSLVAHRSGPVNQSCGSGSAEGRGTYSEAGKWLRRSGNYVNRRRGAEECAFLLKDALPTTGAYRGWQRSVKNRVSNQSCPAIIYVLVPQDSWQVAERVGGRNPLAARSLSRRPHPQYPANASELVGRRHGCQGRRKSCSVTAPPLERLDTE